jgi:hypothetical protein
MRLPWTFNATLSLSKTIRPRLSHTNDWRHTEQLSAHLVKIRWGGLRIVRLRHTENQARRLGLPII